MTADVQEALQDLGQKVEAQKTAVDGFIGFTGTLVAKLQAIGSASTDPETVAAINALADLVSTETQKVADALTTDTADTEG